MNFTFYKQNQKLFVEAFVTGRCPKGFILSNDDPAFYFSTEDVTYDFKLDKKYNFITIFDEIDKQMDKDPSVIYPKATAYTKENLIATRANNLIDGKRK
jgi:hypothetical protein